MSRLSTRFKLFSVSYSPEYKTFLPKFVASDPSHPLYEAQKRRATERARDGLWWHVTTGGELSKSSCVRGWARRRLRTAIIEELKVRGYDENGKVAQVASLGNGGISADERLFDLKGSLRLHAQPPLVPAKFVSIKAEVGKLIHILVKGVGTERDSQANVQKKSPLPQRDPPKRLGRSSCAPSPQ